MDPFGIMPRHIPLDVFGSILSNASCTSQIKSSIFCMRCHAAETHSLNCLTDKTVPLTKKNDLGDYLVYKGFCLGPSCYTLEEAKNLLQKIPCARHRQPQTRQATSASPISLPDHCDRQCVPTPAIEGTSARASRPRRQSVGDSRQANTRMKRSGDTDIVEVLRVFHQRQYALYKAAKSSDNFRKDPAGIKSSSKVMPIESTPVKHTDLLEPELVPGAVSVVPPTENNFQTTSSVDCNSSNSEAALNGSDSNVASSTAIQSVTAHEVAESTEKLLKRLNRLENQLLHIPVAEVVPDVPDGSWRKAIKQAAVSSADTLSKLNLFARVIRKETSMNSWQSADGTQKNYTASVRSQEQEDTAMHQLPRASSDSKVASLEFDFGSCSSSDAESAPKKPVALSDDSHGPQMKGPMRMSSILPPMLANQELSKDISFSRTNLDEALVSQSQGQGQERKEAALFEGVYPAHSALSENEVQEAVVTQSKEGMHKSKWHHRAFRKLRKKIFFRSGQVKKSEQPSNGRGSVESSGHARQRGVQKFQLSFRNKRARSSQDRRFRKDQRSISNKNKKRRFKKFKSKKLVLRKQKKHMKTSVKKGKQLKDALGMLRATMNKAIIPRSTTKNLSKSLSFVTSSRVLPSNPVVLARMADGSNGITSHDWRFGKDPKTISSIPSEDSQEASIPSTLPTVSCQSSLPCSDSEATCTTKQDVEASMVMQGCDTEIAMANLPNDSFTQPNVISDAYELGKMPLFDEIKEDQKIPPTSRKSEGFDRLTLLQASPLVYRNHDTYEYHALPQLDFDSEARAIKKELACAESGRIEVECNTGTTDRLSATFAQASSRVLHLSCHGLQDSCIALEDGYGGMQALSVNELKRFVSKGGGMLDMVFVSACYSQSIGEAFLEAGVKHVVCCRHDERLRDVGALEFARIFYRALACNKSLKDAFCLAQEGVRVSPMVKGCKIEADKYMLLPKKQDDDPYHDIPVFFARSVPCRSPTPKKRKDVVGYVPCTPRHFIGRSVVMHEIIDALLHADVVRVVGPSKIGKTSVVAAVARYVLKRRNDLDIDDLFWLPKPEGQHVKESLYGNLCKMFRLLSSSHDHSICDPSGYNECWTAIREQLHDKRVVLVIDGRQFQSEGASENLEKFLHDMLEYSYVKVIVIGSQDCKSQNAVHCQNDKTIKLDPLDFKNSVELFGLLSHFVQTGLCPFARTQQQFVQRLLHHSNPRGLQNILFDRLGRGNPGAIRRAAINMAEAEFIELMRIVKMPPLKEDSRAALEATIEILHRRLAACKCQEKFVRCQDLKAFVEQLENLRSRFPVLTDLQAQESKLKMELSLCLKSDDFRRARELQRGLKVIRDQIIKEKLTVIILKKQR